MPPNLNPVLLKQAANFYNYRLESSVEQLVPIVKSRGYVTKPEFLTVCEWKSSRIRSRVSQNNADLIEEVTRIALSTRVEPLRLTVLTVLYGVQFPVASTFLHWFHDDPYPILDFRALESLQIPQPKLYDTDFWADFVDEWRKEQAKSGLSVRDFDRALWQISKSQS